MKKFLTVTMLVIMLMMVALTTVNAATTSTLPGELYAIGSKYGMKESDKVEIERYLSENALSEADCNKILALAKEADAVMTEQGTTDYKSLPADVKSKLQSLANSAASIAGVTLDFTAKGVEVYKDGKLISTVTSKDALPYTGNEMNTVLVVSSVAVVALATAFIARKKIANA